MKNQDEQPLQAAADDAAISQEYRDVDAERMWMGHAPLRLLLLAPLPSGSAEVAQVWIRQVVAALQWEQLAQAWAVVTAVMSADDLPLTEHGLALLLWKASARLENAVGLPAGRA